MKILRFAAVVCNGIDVSWIESESLDSVAVVRGGDCSVSVTGGIFFLLGTQPPPFPIMREKNWECEM